MSIEEQIRYWTTGSAEDFAAAEALLEGGYLRQCLFLAHLALEKMLKAVVTRRTGDVAPRIGSLPGLAESAQLTLDGEQMDVLCRFGAYDSESGCLGTQQPDIDARLARDELRRTKDMLACLSEGL